MQHYNINNIATLANKSKKRSKKDIMHDFAKMIDSLDKGDCIQDELVAMYKNF